MKICLNCKRTHDDGCEVCRYCHYSVFEDYQGEIFERSQYHSSSRFLEIIKIFFICLFVGPFLGKCLGSFTENTSFAHLKVYVADLVCITIWILGIVAIFFTWKELK